MFILRDWRDFTKARFVYYTDGEYPELRKPTGKKYVKDLGISKEAWEKLSRWLTVEIRRNQKEGIKCQQ